MPTGNTVTQKLPVVVWGNGGCSGDGSSNAVFLQMLASHGYLAIASGAPGGRTSTTAQLMTASIDFVTKVAGTGSYANVDANKIFAAGFSCGGVEAMAQSWDSRVKSIGIFSSGLLTNYTAASTFTKPILYVLGGSSDIAYANVSGLFFLWPRVPRCCGANRGGIKGERDFKALPAATPSWKGNLPLGHGGDLFQANGGKFGRAGLAWLEYIFKGNETAKTFILGEGYKADGWDVQTHALDQLKPFV
jgi:hypothetical protein